MSTMSSEERWDDFFKRKDMRSNTNKEYAEALAEFMNKVINKEGRKFLSEDLMFFNDVRDNVDNDDEFEYTEALTAFIHKIINKEWRNPLPEDLEIFNEEWENGASDWAY